MIAYARCVNDGCPGTGPWDIIVHNLQTGATNNITSAIADSTDRPSFSPDGTRIAYGKNVGGTNFDIVTQPVAGGPETPVATSADNEEKPAWTPDSQTIFYQRQVGAMDRDIYRSPATGGTATPVLTGMNDEYQPAVSPDGQNLCFTRGAFGTNNAQVMRSTLAGGLRAEITSVDSMGSYNCVWSPDGSMIAYANGIFGNAQLVSRASDGTGPEIDRVTNCLGAACFDGNPDWLHNPPPTCANTLANVAFNSFTTIQLSCTDDPDPPGYAPNNPDPEIVTPPSNGSLGGLNLNDDSVVYTPNVNFAGTDTFTYTGSDGTSQAPVATVTISVAGPPPGPAPGGDTTAPVISRVSLSSRRFRRGSRLPAVSQRVRVGTTIRFDIDEAARATFTFHRVLPGRRVGGRCRKPSRRNRGKRRCTRYVRAGSFSLSAKAGANRVRFHGRLSRGKRLRPGKHRLTLGARDAAGNRSRARTARFTIVR